MISVTFFYRSPRKTGLSIEGIFSLVSDCLKDKVIVKSFYCDSAQSNVANTIEAGKHTSDVNHITGDVHYLAIGFKKGKNILTIHDLGHYSNLRKKSFIRFQFFKWFWYKLPLLNLDIVTVVSNFTKEKVMSELGVPESKIRVVHDPIKPVFKFTQPMPRRDKFHILQVGTGPHKNLKGLLDAVKGCQQYHIDIVAYPNESDLQLLNAAGVSYTVYNGLTDHELYMRYVECDILFFASFHEGFGMPIIEAQAVGRPVITSGIGAMKEVAGETAALVNPQKPEEIRAAIDWLYTDATYYNQLVELGRENNLPYTHEVIAAQYLQIYKELTAQ